MECGGGRDACACGPGVRGAGCRMGRAGEVRGGVGILSELQMLFPRFGNDVLLIDQYHAGLCDKSQSFPTRRNSVGGYFSKLVRSGQGS